MRALQVDAVPHGFRSSFRDWAAECTDVPREVCELALAHVNGDRASRPPTAAATCSTGVARLTLLPTETLADSNPVAI